MDFEKKHTEFDNFYHFEVFRIPEKGIKHFLFVDFKTTFLKVRTETERTFKNIHIGPDRPFQSYLGLLDFEPHIGNLY